MKNQKESELPLNDYFMSKFFRVSLVAAYVGLTAFVPIQALKFWGHFLSPLAILGWFFGWSAYCLVGAQAQVELMLCRMQVRKPLKDEQCRMCGYFDHVLQLAGIARSFQLLILEEPGFNAFATGRRTIVLSRDLLEKMKTPQIEAILAHELGHHVSNDCLTTGVYFAANLPAMYCIEISKLVWKKLCICRRHFKIKRRLLLFFVIIGLVILGIAHMLLPVLETLALILAIKLVNRLFLFLWKIISRFTEYKQDAYAAQLGYSKALKEALVIFTQQEPQNFRRFETLMRGSHPLVYNRIRRLEELEGVR